MEKIREDNLVKVLCFIGHFASVPKNLLNIGLKTGRLNPNNTTLFLPKVSP
jgi:hypothetical protein